MTTLVIQVKDPVTGLTSAVSATLPPVSSPPVSATRFGAFCGPDNYPNTNPTESKATMRSTVTARFGGHLGVERIFNTTTINAVPAKGTSSILCFDPPDVVAFANGANDTDVDTLLTGLKANGDTVYLTLLHEADDSKCTGPQLVAALDHLRARRDAIGAHNVYIGPILMSFTLLTGGNWQQFCSPRDEFMGWDGYIRPTGASVTAHGLLDPIVATGKQLGLPLVLGELSIGKQGSGGGFTDAQWAQITSDMLSILTAPANGFAAVAWFETNKSDGDWRLAPHTAALASYKAAVVASPH